MVKKISLWCSSGLLRFSLLLLATASVAVLVFGNPEHIKNVLKTNSIYETSVDAVLEQAKKSTEKSEDGELPISDPKIQEIAKTAFSADFLRSSTEKIINGVYRWLEGEVKVPDFNVDIAATKQTLVAGFSRYAADKLAALPICPKSQKVVNVDPFEATCRPANLNIEAEQKRFSDELLNNPDFLPDTVITAENLSKDANGKTVFDNLKEAPKAFQASKKAPWALGFLAALFGLGVLLLSENRRRGVKNLGTTLIGVGLVLWLFGYGASYLFHQAVQPNGSLGKNLQDSSFEKASVNAIDDLGSIIGQRLLWFAAAYLLLGIVSLLVIRFYWKESKPAEPKEKSPESPVETRNEAAESKK